MTDRDDTPKVRLSEIGDKLELEYPCRWLYKVIGSDAESVRLAILEIIDEDSVTIEPSHRSSGGSYVSFNVEVTVVNESQRTGWYEALREHDDVRMVL